MDNKYRVLVIDDETIILDLLQSSLTEHGYEVLIAADGLDGFEKACHLLPDLILLDIMMPDIDGYEILDKLKTNNLTKSIPVIFLTAKIDGEDRVKGLESGAVDYITKPFFIKEVIARINIHLRLKEYEDELTRKNQELEEFSDLLLELNSKLEEMARKDDLMKVWNRRAFNEQVKNIHSYSHRYKHPYSIIIADLDHFKNYNDLYGHQKGDMVLIMVAQAIVESCRSTDFVARYGGEEIVVLLPETAQEAALLTADRIVTAVKNLQIEHDNNEGLGVVTVSAGTATFVPEKHQNASWEMVLKRADDALYLAKNTGRNKVCEKN